MEGKLIEIWIEFGELHYFNIYNMYMYKHNTIRNLLIGYLTFILVIGNLETTDRLTGYLVKVHSTNVHTYIHTQNTHTHRHKQRQISMPEHTHAPTHTLINYPPVILDHVVCDCFHVLFC